jgi:hypothetical protein
MDPITNNPIENRPAVDVRQVPVAEQPPLSATGLTPARFSDMYRSAIAAAVDADGDGRISEAELERQIVHAGGSAGSAQAQWQALDSDHDGKVSTDDYAKTLADPLGNERDALLRRIVDDLKQGKDAVRPQGDVLDASGKVADPQAALRYLAATFPGNMQY